MAAAAGATEWNVPNKVDGYMKLSNGSLFETLSLAMASKSLFVGRSILPTVTETPSPTAFISDRFFAISFA